MPTKKQGAKKKDPRGRKALPVGEHALPIGVSLDPKRRARLDGIMKALDVRSRSAAIAVLIDEKAEQLGIE
jgi:hypothetical protein